MLPRTIIQACSEDDCAKIIIHTDVNSYELELNRSVLNYNLALENTLSEGADYAGVTHAQSLTLR